MTETVSAEDDAERRRLLESLRTWGASNAFRCSVVLYGSLVRGDWWKTRDADLMVVGEDGPAMLCEESLKRWGNSEGIDAEVWRLEPAVLRYVAAIESSRRTISNGAAPIQFGLHGFDTIDHHEAILGPDPLKGFPVPREPKDLRLLARDRIRGLATRGLVGFLDAPSKKVIEGMKSAVLLLGAESSPPREPTRDKRQVFDLFVELAPSFARRDVVERAWKAYRDRHQPAPSPLELEDCVQALATAFVGSR